MRKVGHVRLTFHLAKRLSAAKRKLWLNDGSGIRLRPTHRDHVRADDFVQDRTCDGRVLWLPAPVDEYTRKCLAIGVTRQLSSEHVLERPAFQLAVSEKYFAHIVLLE